MASSTRQGRAPASKNHRREMLSRSGVVTDWGGSLFVHADRLQTGEEKRRTLAALDLRGTLNKAVKGASAFELSVVPCDEEPSLGNVEIPCVGVFTATKPALRGSVYLSRLEFDLVVALATGGRLRGISVDFQEPHYGTALIANVSFGSEPMEYGSDTD